MAPNLIDTHTHVQFAAYQDDYVSVIEKSLTSGIWLVNIGTQRDTSAKAIEIAEKYKEGVYATVGLHPIHAEKSYHDAKELGDGIAAKEFTSRGEDFDYEYYKKLGGNSKVVAIGECGLDYYRLNETTKERQKIAFLQQIRLAKELDKPLMIHCREAFGDLIDILKYNSDILRDTAGVMHFFSGSMAETKELLDLNFYFSFGGVITFTRDYEEIIKYIPLSRILLETDAPYVTPAPFRGKRNEPSYVSYVAEALAKTFNVSKETVADVTTANALKVFKI